jgi:hypothetical protein
VETLKTLALAVAAIVILELCCAVILYCMNMSMPTWMRLSLVRVPLSRFKWYRKWYGGRWEYWFIEMCMSAMWLEMKRTHCWPEFGPCSGRGTPTIEDYYDD